MRQCNTTPVDMEYETATVEKCYACEKAATTVEHCPPKSFFPEGHRGQLLTVPSCALHNNENSKDVEYTRNVLTTVWGVNGSGLSLFVGKVKRSLERSPGLLATTFGSMQAVAFEGQITGAFRIDTNRLYRVFNACVTAIHYHDTGTRHGTWSAIAPQLMFAEEIPKEDQSRWDQLVGMLRTIPFSRHPVANPDVFEYGTGMVDGHHFYCFLFYQSFVVYAFPLPEGFQPIRL
jgi:hypothetical protein